MDNIQQNYSLVEKIRQGEGPARLPVTKAIKLINHFCFETVIRE